MPTYEYVCVECGNRVEVLQRFGDEPPTVCEVCGGQLRKVFHPAGIVLKGSGFYRTDSRAAAKASKERSESKGGEKGREKKSSEKSGSEKSGSDTAPSDKSSSGKSSSDAPKKEAS